MIIRMTLQSYKYTQIIEKYFYDGGPFVATHYRSVEEYKKFIKNIESYNRFSMSYKRKGLKEKLERDIKKTLYII